MGRDCGMIALGTAYGQPDIILVPESPVDPDPLVERVLSILDIQKHAVLCVSEGIVDTDGQILGAVTASKDPAGNIQYTGAAEAVKRLLVEKIGDAFFTRKRRNESADAAIFVRKIGHTQRGGRPILFDRFYASQLGGKAVELLLQGYHNCVATLQYRDGGVRCSTASTPTSSATAGGRSTPGRSRRRFYDPKRFQPSAKGIEYLRSIFTNALGVDDVESIRSIFNTGNLIHPYDSVNVDINKRIHRLGRKPSSPTTWVRRLRSARGVPFVARGSRQSPRPRARLSIENLDPRRPDFHPGVPAAWVPCHDHVPASPDPTLTLCARARGTL